MYFVFDDSEKKNRLMRKKKSPTSPDCVKESDSLSFIADEKQNEVEQGELRTKREGRFDF